MEKRNYAQIQNLKTAPEEAFNPEESTNDDFAYIRTKHAKEVKKEIHSWSERHPKLSKITDTFFSVFFFLALMGGGIICIACATTILVEGTKALIRIIGSIFGW